MATRVQAKQAKEQAAELVRSLGGNVLSVGLAPSDSGFAVSVTVLEPVPDTLVRELEQRDQVLVGENVPLKIEHAMHRAVAN